MRQMKICPIRCHHTIIIIIIILVIVLDTMGLVVECVNKIQCKNRTAIPVFFCLLITNFFSNINFTSDLHLSQPPPPSPLSLLLVLHFFLSIFILLYRNKLSLNAALVQLPIGKEQDFSGVIDLINRKTYRFTGKAG